MPPFRAILARLLIVALAACLPADRGHAQAETADSTDWCRLDDPAEYLQRLRAARREGREVSETPPPCPEFQPALDLPDTLVATLPCGRAMVFKRVRIRVRDILDQAVGEFGGTFAPDSIRGRYTRGDWSDAVSGAFSARADGVPVAEDFDTLAFRDFYVAKYELTELQYSLAVDGVLEAFTGEGSTPEQREQLCAAIEERAGSMKPSAVLPKTGLSWYDAIRLSRIFNLYFFAESVRRIKNGVTPLLPWEQGSPGYLRLPTEVEWEFAARGGQEVGPSTSPTYLIRAEDGSTRFGSLDEVAVTSNGGRSVIRGVGRKAPNLLGLHDMIGNASELVHDLFRMTRPGSMHGHSGGVVLRGGNALTPVSDLGVGHRAEMPIYNMRGEGRSGLAGVRFVVSAPVFVDGLSRGDRFETGLRNPEFETALQHAHQDLLRGEEIPGAEFRNQARGRLSTLREAVVQRQDASALLSELDALQSALDASEAALVDAARAALVEKVRTAVISALTIRSSGRLSYTILLRLENDRERLAEVLDESTRKRLETVITGLEDNWRSMEDQIGYQLRHWVAIVRDLARHDPQELDNAVKLVRDGFDRENLIIYDPSWEVLKPALLQFSQEPSAEVLRGFREMLDDTREKRRERFGLILD